MKYLQITRDEYSRFKRWNVNIKRSGRWIGHIRWKVNASDYVFDLGGLESIKYEWMKEIIEFIDKLREEEE